MPYVLALDQGTSSSRALLDTARQVLADVLGLPVERPAQTETTALGAAYLAGLGVGLWPDLSALVGQWQLERRFEPAMDAQTRRALEGRWRQALERTLGWGRS